MSRPLPPDPNLLPDASELERLSAYLDNALPALERAALEQRLSQEPALRRELEALRGTLAVLKNAPALAPPRNFTLDPAQYRRPTPINRRIRWLPVSVIGAVAALLLVALIASRTLSNVAAPPYRSIAAPVTGGQIAILPTVVPTSAALQESSPTAASNPLIPATATRSAEDTVIEAPATATLPPAVVAPLRPTSAAAQATSVPQVATSVPALLPTLAAASSGAASSQNGATNASGSFAGPSIIVPGTAPATQAAQLAPAVSTPSLPSEPILLALLLRWLLILLGLKG